MNIALLGYGKMGRIIEQEALLKGHTIGLKINSENTFLLKSGVLKEVDVAIDFSNPDSVLNNIYHAFDAGIPIVVGTTGWLNNWNMVAEDARCRNASLFYASNFSLGVNLFFQLNKVLGQMMNEFPEYEMEIRETHHTEKKDAPSGTALSLAHILLENIQRKKNWVNYLIKDTFQENDFDMKPIGKDQLPIYSFRVGNHPGQHEVRFISEEDEIIISHRAKSRKGFALGAIFAAEWLLDKKGVFTMEDLIKF